MDIVKKNYIAFAYTIKSLGVNKDDDYSPFFNKLKRLNITVEYKISERDSKGKLHYHGIIYLKKGFYRKRLLLRGYHIKLEEIYDKAGWIKYIHKDVYWDYVEPDSEEYIDDYVESVKPTKRLF